MTQGYWQKSIGTVTRAWSEMVYIKFDKRKKSGYYTPSYLGSSDFDRKSAVLGDKIWETDGIDGFDYVRIADTDIYARKIEWFPGKKEKILAVSDGPLVNYAGIYDEFGPWAVDSLASQAGQWSTIGSSSRRPLWLTKSKNKGSKKEIFKEYSYRIGKAPLSREVNRKRLSDFEVAYNRDFTGDGIIGGLGYQSSQSSPGDIPLPVEILSQAYEFPGFSQVPYPYVIAGPGLPSGYSNAWGGGFSPSSADHPKDYLYKWFGVNGSGENDVIIGGKYVDLINGGAGDDILFGGNLYQEPFVGLGPTGNGVVFQNGGHPGKARANDVLTGGSGSDTFILNTRNIAFIEDFELGVDRLRFFREQSEFGGGELPGFRDLAWGMSDGGSSVLTAFGNVVAYIVFSENQGLLTESDIVRMV